MKIDYAALGFTLAGAMIAAMIVAKVAEMLIQYGFEMIVGVCL